MTKTNIAGWDREDLDKLQRKIYSRLNRLAVYPLLEYGGIIVGFNAVINADIYSGIGGTALYMFGRLFSLYEKNNLDNDKSKLEKLLQEGKK